MSDKKPVPPSLAQFALEQLAEAGEQAAIDLTVQNVEILRAEIERRDVRIVELEADVLQWRANSAENKLIAESVNAELAALKARQPSAGAVSVPRELLGRLVDMLVNPIHYSPYSIAKRAEELRALLASGDEK